jgi:integrase
VQRLEHLPRQVRLVAAERGERVGIGEEAALAQAVLLQPHLPAQRLDLPPQLPGLDLCDKFLDWVELHRGPDTYEDYHDGLAAWVKLHGDRRARDIHSLDLEEWKGKLVKKGLATCTVNHAVIAVKVCWSWAVKQELPLLPSNPLQRVQKLDAEGRERTFTADEFLALLRNTDALFRQVLLFFRLTGIRPGEFCRLTWEQVRLAQHVLVIRRHKSRRTAKVKKPRTIHLPPAAEGLLRWRLRKLGHAPETRPATLGGERVFLNSDGQPWTVNALRSARGAYPKLPTRPL